MASKILSGMIVLLTVATAAWTQTLDVPFVIPADGDGAFRYTAEMTYPASGAYFGGYTIDGTQNIAEGTTWIDGFCLSWVEGLAVVSFEITGHLADPAQNGNVMFEWFGCDPGFSLTAPTLVLRPLVANEPVTWTALKRAYR